jgi:hypothetical protein
VKAATIGMERMRQVKIAGPQGTSLYVILRILISGGFGDFLEFKLL